MFAGNCRSHRTGMAVVPAISSRAVRRTWARRNPGRRPCSLVRPEGKCFSGESKRIGTERAIFRQNGTQRLTMSHGIIRLLCLLLISLGMTPVALSRQSKPRIIVTTDGEVDDMNGFIRLLHYANEFEIEGLVYSSSMWHYAGDGEGTLFTSRMPYTARRYGERTELRWTGTTWMQDFIDLYAQSYENLLRHKPDFPSPEHLKSLVRVGNIDFEGEMEKVTEGSELIREVLLDDKPGPVHVQIWGGTNTLARALKCIEEAYRGTEQWEAIHRKVSEKAALYIILGQDMTYDEYVLPNWPGIKAIFNRRQPRGFAYGWRSSAPKEFHRYLNGQWFSTHILNDRGPLLARYFTYGDGQPVVGDYDVRFHTMEETIRRGHQQYDLISEWNTPAWLYNLDPVFGLRRPGDPPSYGGLGGRFKASDKGPRKWNDVDSGDGDTPVADLNPFTGKPDPHYPQTRWIPVLQNDFAARALWNVKAYGEVNRPPVVTLNHPHRLTARTGQRVDLSGSASDPDGDELAYSWWQYVEAGTYRGTVRIEDANSPDAAIVVPAEARTGDTIHLLLEVTDDGAPPLTRYQRVVVEVTGGPLQVGCPVKIAAPRKGQWVATVRVH